MKNQKGFVQILLIIGIVVALGVIGYALYIQRSGGLPKTGLFNPQTVPSPYQGTYRQSGQAIAPIKNGSDLTTASGSLDSTDMTQFDTQLNALNSASSGF